MTKDEVLIEHTLYPVSFIADDGRQINTVWTHNPSGDEYWVGDPLYVTAIHPDNLPKSALKDRIAETENRLAQLKEELENENL